MKTRSYEIVSPPDTRGPCALLVAVAEVKRGSWVQNCEGGIVKRDDK